MRLSQAWRDSYALAVLVIASAAAIATSPPRPIPLTASVKGEPLTLDNEHPFAERHFTVRPNPQARAQSPSEWTIEAAASRCQGNSGGACEPMILSPFRIYLRIDGTDFNIPSSSNENNFEHVSEHFELACKPDDPCEVGFTVRFERVAETGTHVIQDWQVNAFVELLSPPEKGSEVALTQP